MSDLERIKQIKKSVLMTAFHAKVGHIPSSFSCLEILYVLYNKIAHIRKDNAADLDRDRVVISKEHARLGQVCVLADAGLLDKKLLEHFMANEDAALGHDLYNVVRAENKDLAAVDVASGALGHGLSVGVGLAWDNPHHVFVVVGDAELQEGTNWEAIMFAGFHQMKNLTIIVDENSQQIDEYTPHILDISSNLKKKFEVFGFEVLECDGHDVQALEKCLKVQTDKPKALIAKTIKGKECLFWREEVGFGYFHAGPMNEDQLRKTMEKIEKC